MSRTRRGLPRRPGEMFQDEINRVVDATETQTGHDDIMRQLARSSVSGRHPDIKGPSDEAD